MSESDCALLEIRKNEDDVNLREQRADLLHPLKLLPVRSRENGDRIRFYGQVRSLSLRSIQAFKGLYSTLRDHFMDGRLKPLGILIIPIRIKQELHRISL